MTVHTHPTIPCPICGFGSDSQLVKTFESFIGENENLSDEERKELQTVGAIDPEPLADRFHQFINTFNADPQVKVHLDALNKIKNDLMDKFFTEEDFIETFREYEMTYREMVAGISSMPAEEVTLAEWLLLNG